ncbi:MAG: T9SS type A sorting domain-containing protein [Flavobacteriales bacterium]
MKNNVIYILFLLPGFLLAQESINSSGGEASGGGYLFSYSIGQVVSSSFGDNAVSLAQGVQQQYVEEDNGVMENFSDLGLSVFPNPFIETFTITFPGETPEAYEFQLMDANGKLIEHGRLTGKETLIKTEQLPTANYYLSLNSGERKSTVTYKLIKF